MEPARVCAPRREHWTSSPKKQKVGALWDLFCCFVSLFHHFILAARLSEAPHFGLTLNNICLLCYRITRLELWRFEYGSSRGIKLWRLSTSGRIVQRSVQKGRQQTRHVRDVQIQQTTHRLVPCDLTAHVQLLRSGICFTDIVLRQWRRPVLAPMVTWSYWKENHCCVRTTNLLITLRLVHVEKK